MALIDCRFGLNLTSLTSPFFAAVISWEYVSFASLSRFGISVWLAR